MLKKLCLLLQFCGALLFMQTVGASDFGLLSVAELPLRLLLAALLVLIGTYAKWWLSLREKPRPRRRHRRRRRAA